MASKQAAQKMSAHAAWMKIAKIQRTTAVCPVNHRHTYSLNKGLSDHFMRCS